MRDSSRYSEKNPPFDFPSSGTSLRLECVLQTLSAIHKQTPNSFDCIQIKRDGSELILWNKNKFVARINLFGTNEHPKISTQYSKQIFGSLDLLTNEFDIEIDHSQSFSNLLTKLCCLAVEQIDPVFNRRLFVNIRYHFNPHFLNLNAGYGDIGIFKLDESHFLIQKENMSSEMISIEEWPNWIERQYGLDRNLYLLYENSRSQ